MTGEDMTERLPTENREGEPLKGLEILDLEKHGALYGRFLKASLAKTQEEADNIIDPNNTKVEVNLTAQDLEGRKYNLVCERSSIAERKKQWEEIPLFDDAYKQWRTEFTGFMTGITDWKRKLARKDIMPNLKKAADFTEGDADQLFNDFCKDGRSNINSFIERVTANLAGRREINPTSLKELLPHLQWIASGLFGKETASNVVTRLIELESAIQNDPKQVVEIFNSNKERINSPRDEEKRILNALHNGEIPVLTREAPVPAFKATGIVGHDGFFQIETKEGDTGFVWEEREKEGRYQCWSPENNLVDPKRFPDSIVVPENTFIEVTMNQQTFVCRTGENSRFPLSRKIAVIELVNKELWDLTDRPYDTLELDTIYNLSKGMQVIDLADFKKLLVETPPIAPIGDVPKSAPVPGWTPAGSPDEDEDKTPRPPPSAQKPLTAAEELERELASLKDLFAPETSPSPPPAPLVAEARAATEGTGETGRISFLDNGTIEWQQHGNHIKIEKQQETWAVSVFVGGDRIRYQYNLPLSYYDLAGEIGDSDMGSDTRTAEKIYQSLAKRFLDPKNRLASLVLSQPLSLDISAGPSHTPFILKPDGTLFNPDNKESYTLDNIENRDLFNQDYTRRIENNVGKLLLEAWIERPVPETPAPQPVETSSPGEKLKSDVEAEPVSSPEQAEFDLNNNSFTGTTDEEMNNNLHEVFRGLGGELGPPRQPRSRSRF